MAEWSSKAQRSRDEPGQEKRYLPDILPVLGKLEPYEAPKRNGVQSTDKLSSLSRLPRDFKVPYLFHDCNLEFFFGNDTL